jgi:solute carrier family 25 citrate transporter 1
MFFLAGIPMLKSKVIPYCPNDAVATLCSGMGAGVGATMASQAFDTIKTVQQTATSPIKAIDAVTKVYSTHGVYGFFKGSIPRGARVVSAVTIMGAIKEKMEQYLDSDNEFKTAPKMK